MQKNNEEIYMISCAISGIETIRDAAKYLQTPIDDITHHGNLNFWASIGEALSEEIPGEALGLMMGMLVDVVRKGHMISDILDIQLLPRGDGLVLQIIVQDKDGKATTLH